VSFDVDENTAKEQVDEICEAVQDRDYCLQLIHATASARKRTIVIVFYDGTGKDAILLAVRLNVGHNLRKRHVRVLDLLGRSFFDAVREVDDLPELAPKFAQQYAGREDELERLVALTRAAIKLKVNRPVQTLKPIAAVLHNMLKTGPDALGAELSTMRFTGCGELMPIFHGIALVAVTAMRSYRIYRMAESIKFDVEALDDCPSVREIRKKCNAYGSICTLIRACAQAGGMSDDENQAHSEHGEDAAKSAFPSGFDAESITRLRDEAARCPDKISSFNSEILTWFRLTHNPDIGLVHTPMIVPSEDRMRCGLSCDECRQVGGTYDGHARNPPKVAARCKACGVFLSLNEEFGERSAWTCWHSERVLKHPREGLTTALSFDSDMDRVHSNSAKAARKRKFVDALVDVTESTRTFTARINSAGSASVKKLQRASSGPPTPSTAKKKRASSVQAGGSSGGKRLKR
jgi:hypothetical protein